MLSRNYPSCPTTNRYRLLALQTSAEIHFDGLQSSSLHCRHTFWSSEQSDLLDASKYPKMTSYVHTTNSHDLLLPQCQLSQHVKVFETTTFNFFFCLRVIFIVLVVTCLFEVSNLNPEYKTTNFKGSVSNNS